MFRTFDDNLCDLNDKSILVTGGSGSFGRQFIRTVLSRFKPRRLVIYSRDEAKQYDMAQDLSIEQHKCLRYFIGDVRDADRLELAFRDIDYVIHAAALKQVPAAEYNPFECIQTNVHGAENIVKMALRSDVKAVLALSTDKAANPINLYGASKLASDKIFIAANNLSGSRRTLFSVVRYGNVLGSRGSVMPLFAKLIESKAESLPITDERMTRFSITLQQGVNFVLSSIKLMRGGEIFVPKIPSLRVVDLARAMAPDLPQRIVGIRPGEKLHETMVPIDDARMTLELNDRYIIEPAFAWWSRDSYLGDGAKPMSEGFTYTSDNNSEWLDDAGIRRQLAEIRGE